MRTAGLVAWCLTALLGLYLLRTWIVNGGLRGRRTGRPSRFAPALILGHGGLAATGLAVWVGFLVVGAEPLAWLALAILVPVAALGSTMFVKGHLNLPVGGHRSCPLAVTRSARWWPRDLPGAATTG